MTEKSAPYAQSNSQLIRADTFAKHSQCCVDQVTRAVTGLFESFGYRTRGFFSGVCKGRCCASATEYARAYALSRQGGSSVNECLKDAQEELADWREKKVNEILGKGK